MRPEFDTTFIELAKEVKEEASQIEGDNITAENVVKQTGGISALDLWNMDTREIPKLLGDFITKVGLMLLVGSSDAGKSMFCRDLVLSLVAGDDEFIGMPFNTDVKRKAIVVSTEDDDLAISYLIRQRQLKNKSFNPDTVLKNLVFFFDSEEIFERLETNLKLNPVDVILLDTMGDILDNPNDNGEVRRKLNSCKRLAIKYQCLFIVMHHTSKRTEGKAPDKSSILGGASIEQKVRLALELRSDTNDLSIKHLSVLKGNYLAKEYKGSSFVLEMDEDTFNFSNTGERISFDDLAVPEATSVSPNKSKVPPFDEIGPENMRAMLIPIFHQFPNGLLRNDLKDKLARSLRAWYNLEVDPGRDKVLSIINNCLLDKLLIKPTGKGAAAFIKLPRDMYDESAED